MKFTKEENLIIMEAARVALADAESFDNIANELDLNDDFLANLSEKLQKHLNEE